MAQDLPTVSRSFKPLAGQNYSVSFPFVRDTYDSYGCDGVETLPTWKPGVVFEWVSPEDTAAFADGEGLMVLTVVDVFKPGKFPARVFYTRKFVDPDGKAFGKSGLRICTTEKFNRLARGYRHPYTMGGALKKPNQAFPLDYHGFAGFAGSDSVSQDF